MFAPGVRESGDTSHRVLQPRTSYFHVSFGERCPQGVVLAPGESCKFKLTFLTEAGVNVEDNLIVKSEMCVANLNLIARNPFPWVEIPPAIDMGPCLVGNELSFLLPVRSNGAGATFRLSSSDINSGEDFNDLFDSQNILKVESFFAYPKHFNLKKDESGEIVIVFMPPSPGQFALALRIITECGREFGTQISGCGINLQINAQDDAGKSFNMGEPGGEIFFGSTTVFSTHVYRRIWIENKMSVSVHYEWRVEESICATEVERGLCGKENTAAFICSPCSGLLEAESRTSFIFNFTPKEPQPYRQLVSLYIAARSVGPSQSKRWKEMKELMQKLEMQACNIKASSEHCRSMEESGEWLSLMSSKVLGDGGGRAMKVMSLKFSGYGEPPCIEFVPPVLHILDIVEQGQAFVTTVLLKNSSGVDISFSWQLPYVSCVTEQAFNYVTVLPLIGTVNAMDVTELKVQIKARAIGRISEKLICQIIGGPVIALYVEGCIQGPSIQITPAILDFETVQVGNDCSLDISITNISPHPASFKFSTPSKLPIPILELDESIGDDAKLTASTSCQDKPYNVSSKDSELIFYPSEGTLRAKERTSIKAIFKPVTCGKAKWAIACEVAGGKSATQYAIAHTVASVSDIYLMPSTVDFGITYLGLPIQKSVFMENLSPLPCEFDWAEAVRDFAYVTIEPVKGLLHPHSKQELSFKLTPKECGEKKFSLGCQVSGMVQPLELGFRLYVSDLSCRILLAQPLKLNRSNYSKTEYSKPKLSSIDRSKLPVLNFGKRCPLGIVQTLRVIVQNETPVVGKVMASVAKYGLLLSEKQTSELTGRHVEGESKGAPILNDCREHVNHQFWTESGCAMSLQRQWASTCIKEGDRGLSIVLSSSEGTLDAWKSWCCDVFCYTSMPGTYTDILQIKVDDNIEYKIPIFIGVVGKPLSMRKNCFEPLELCRTGEKNCMTLNWGAVHADYPLRTKTFWVSSCAPYDLELEWEFYEPFTPEENCATIKAVMDVEDEEQKVNVLMFGDPDKGPVQVRFEIEETVSIRVDLVEHAERKSQGSPFNIHPAKQCIAPQNSVFFTVTFHSEEAGTFASSLKGNAFIGGSEKDENGVDNQRMLSSLEMLKVSTSDVESKTQAFERTSISPLYISLCAISLPPSPMPEDNMRKSMSLSMG